MKILLCHPGTQYSLILAEQLSIKKLLNKFYSCFIISTHSKFYKHFPYFLKNKLNSRTTTIPPEKLKTFPLLENPGNYTN